MGPAASGTEITGCDALGVDMDPDRAKTCRALGFPVVLARAERLPFPDSLTDGVICRLVLPYTKEKLAIAEFARMLKPGGKMEACYHGLAYYLRLVMFGETFVDRRHAVWAILNTWFQVLTRGRSRRRLSTDVYQSRRRLARLYKANGLVFERDAEAPTFFGMPVFIYHRLRKVRSEKR